MAAFCSCFGGKTKEPKSRTDVDEPMKFSYRELADATKNFRGESQIGKGGFGNVFKGTLRTGQMVAIKQLNQRGKQGVKEFRAEVDVLSLNRHRNIINLIGYCEENEHRILVYDYMAFGSLAEHVYARAGNVKPLPWTVRLRIALDVARALTFLHSETTPPVVLRDLKSSNILLDAEFTAKISDFGLALFVTDDDKTLENGVKGTCGYISPEYGATGIPTRSADIYSFGMIIMELITGRSVVDINNSYLVEHTRKASRKEYAKIADSLLENNYSEDSLIEAVELALRCTLKDATLRPSYREGSCGYMHGRK